MSPDAVRPSPGGLPHAVGAALALAVLASHLPFLGPGYGTDSDCWKLADGLREMITTGRYTASRLPGYPVMEVLSVPFQPLGPVAINALSALAAAACAWLLARILARHGVREAWLGGAAFAFVPAAFIAGTSSIDYLWAIAFALAAWQEAAEGRAWRAGLWLGLATGARMTSALYGVPLAILLLHSPALRRGSAVLRMTLVAVAIAGACYVPGALRYGTELFTFSRVTGGQASALQLVTQATSPGAAGVPWPLIAGQATVLLLGAVGCAAVGLALLSLLRSPRAAATAARLGRGDFWALASLALLEVAVYLRLPHDEGYLLPVVPAVLTGFAGVLSPVRFRALCVALLLSPFVLGIDVEPPKKGATPAPSNLPRWSLPVSGETVVLEPLCGPVFRDHAKRVEQQRVADAVADWWPRRPERFVIACGASQAMMYHLFPQAPYQRPFVRSLPASERARARGQGIAMFALPDVLRRLRAEEGTAVIEDVTALAAEGRK